MKTLITAFACSLVAICAYSQQDPVYSLYVNNPYVINPAYAGHNKFLVAQLSYRTQWMGLDGNAKTANFSTHSSILNNRAGAGIQVIQDVIGENRNTEVQASFSYKLTLSQSTLSFGMQAGLINYSTSPDELTIRHPDDPYFARYSAIAFNTGAGLLLTSDKYMIGLSVPRLLPATVTQDGQRIEVYNQTMYLSGAYQFLLSEKMRFRPAVLIRGMKNNPVSADLHANFVISDVYGAGLFTRNFHTYGVSGSFRYKKMQLGYVFELPTGRSVGTQFTSHELTLAIRTSALRFHDTLAISNF